MTESKVAKNKDLERPETEAMLPPVDVVEDPYGITLYADLAGVPKDKLSVRVDADALSIEGEVSLPMASTLEASHIEVRQARYKRTFTLGKELDVEKVAAEFRNGMLKLSIPKVERAKPRKIDVQVA